MSSDYLSDLIRSVCRKGAKRKQLPPPTRVETVQEYLARGGRITQCPSSKEMERLEAKA